jgi:hypothetical protein
VWDGRGVGESKIVGVDYEYPQIVAFLFHLRLDGASEQCCTSREVSR